MCRAPRMDFRLTTDDLEDGQGERVILRCPVGICQWYHVFDGDPYLLDVDRAVEAHRNEGFS